MRITQATLDKLPSTRLYVSEKTYFIVPYKNAPKPIKIGLETDDFRENGKGLSWDCGVSEAIKRQKTLFGHPVFAAFTIGSVCYVIAKETTNGIPQFAYRYRHRGGKMVSAYDKSRKNPAMRRTFRRLLAKHPYLTLEVGKSQSGKGAHSPGKQSGHRHPTAPNGDKNKAGLHGAKRRALAAGYIAEGMVV